MTCEEPYETKDHDIDSLMKSPVSHGLEDPYHLDPDGAPTIPPERRTRPSFVHVPELPVGEGPGLEA